MELQRTLEIRSRASSETYLRSEKKIELFLEGALSVLKERTRISYRRKLEVDTRYPPVCLRVALGLKWRRSDKEFVHQNPKAPKVNFLVVIATLSTIWEHAIKTGEKKVGAKIWIVCVKCSVNLDHLWGQVVERATQSITPWSWRMNRPTEVGDLKLSLKDELKLKELKKKAPWIEPGDQAKDFQALCLDGSRAFDGNILAPRTSPKYTARLQIPWSELQLSISCTARLGERI